MKKYLKAHKILDRWTTFNGSMQSALGVPEAYDEQRHREALAILGQDADRDLLCVYCGAAAATWDHLENNVRGGRFSGFGHRIYNLVPACRPCNERKGSKKWNVFLDKLDLADKEAREESLRRFSTHNAEESFGWGEIQREFPELAKEYDQLRGDIREKLRSADVVALKIRTAVAARLGIAPTTPDGQD